MILLCFLPTAWHFRLPNGSLSNNFSICRVLGQGGSPPPSTPPPPPKAPLPQSCNGPQAMRAPEHSRRRSSPTGWQSVTRGCGYTTLPMPPPADILPPVPMPPPRVTGGGYYRAARGPGLTSCGPPVALPDVDGACARVQGSVFSAAPTAEGGCMEPPPSTHAALHPRRPLPTPPSTHAASFRRRGDAAPADWLAALDRCALGAVLGCAAEGRGAQTFPLPQGSHPMALQAAAGGVGIDASVLVRGRGGFAGMHQKRRDLGVALWHGCIRREGASEAAPEAVRQAVGGGCQSGWGRLLSVTNAIEAGTWRQGDSGGA